MTLIVDANVLIDYADTDLSVLALYSTHIAPIRVPLAVADEVDSLGRADYENHHLGLIEETLEIARTASGGGGGLSYPDWVCLLTAERTGATCVSKDTSLLNRCSHAGIPTKRGAAFDDRAGRTGTIEPGCGERNRKGDPSRESVLHQRNSPAGVSAGNREVTPRGALAPKGVGRVVAGQDNKSRKLSQVVGSRQILEHLFKSCQRPLVFFWPHLADIPQFPLHGR